MSWRQIFYKGEDLKITTNKGKPVSVKELSQALDSYKGTIEELEEQKKNNSRLTVDNQDLRLRIEELENEKEDLEMLIAQLQQGGTVTTPPPPDPDPTPVELKAFPTAKGAGADATGGRGGSVIHVTTLDWNAAGGLKEALLTSGTRTIVFDVSGEIDASGDGGFEWYGNSDIYDNFYIAGQTAPEGGITVVVNRLTLRGLNNFIIRYVRFRKSTSTPNLDVFATQDCSNFIIDHCTFSNGSDECIDLNSFNGTGRGTSNITVQNCFFQDSKTGCILGDGSNTQTGTFTMIDNLWANISHRFPNMCGGAGSRHDIINNVVYNSNFRTASITTDNTRANVVRNYLKPSANGKGASSDLRWDNFTSRPTTANDSIYAFGNYIATSPTTVDQQYMWQEYPDTQTQIDSSKFTDTQFEIEGKTYTIKTAQQAYDDIIADLGGGANKYLNADGSVTTWQDGKDTSTLDMVINDTFGTVGDTTTPNPLGGYFYNGGFITRYNSVGWDAIPSNTRPAGFYSTNAHIPETYGQANIPSFSATSHTELNADGYTYLEQYLNEVDK